MNQGQSNVERDHREPIYIIESPSAADLYLGRNEGDALSKTLCLADIDVKYYLAVDAEMMKAAFTEIANDILKSDKTNRSSPFIHISAHGSEEGLELTDHDCFYWEMLNKQFFDLDEKLGSTFKINDIPHVARSSICFSACSAYKNYLKDKLENLPFRQMVGPVQDVGGCQALVAYSTFYYQAFVRRSTFPTAVAAMNISSFGEGEDIFQAIRGFDLEELQRISEQRKKAAAQADG